MPPRADRLPPRVRAALWADFHPGCAGPMLRRADAPLDLRGPFPGAPAAIPTYLLRNATAGVFADDEIDVRLRTCPGAAVRVASPSAAKIHPGAGGSARTRLRLEAQPGSRLHFLPQPTILQTDAALAQRVDLICHPRAELLFAEVLVLGRLAMCERLAFAQLDAELRLRGPGGAPHFEERYRLDPRSDAGALDAALGDAGAIVTVILAGGDDFDAARQRLAASLHRLQGCYAGVDELPGGAGLLVRGLAADTRAAAAVVQQVLTETSSGSA